MNLIRPYLDGILKTARLHMFFFLRNQYLFMFVDYQSNSVNKKIINMLVDCQSNQKFEVVFINMINLLLFKHDLKKKIKCY